MNRLNFDQEKQLIEYFRDNPSLWNTKDKDYNNRMLRTQKLETIANYLQLTKKDVYEKYRNLRTTFFREHKRVTNAKSTSSGEPSEQSSSSNTYVSKWRHYQNMLFLTKVERSMKESEGNNGNHNEDSSSTDHLAPSSAHGLNGHHDIELVTDRGQKLIVATPSAANTRPQPMDTSELESPAANHATIVQNSSSSSASIVNHLNSHTGDDLILISDGTAVSGNTILTHNGAAVGIFNSRILSTSSAANAVRPGSLPGTSIATIASNPPSLTPTHSVIYANHPLASAGASATSTLHRIKSEPALTGDLHRQLTSPTGQLIPVPMLSTLPPATLTALANQPSIYSLNHPLPAGALSSPHQVAAAVGAKSNGVFTAAAAVSQNSSTCRGQLSPVTTMQSTPIQASRKSSLLLFTTKDHSPVVSTPTPLALDNSSSLEHSASSAAGSTYVLSNAGLVNASTLSAASVSSSSGLQQTASQQSSSSLSTATNKSAVHEPMQVASTANAKTLDCTEMRDVIKQVVQEAIVEWEDEEMSFCRSLAASLRTLNRSNKEVAKLELQQVITNIVVRSSSAEERPGGLRSNSNGDHNGTSISVASTNNNAVSTIKSGASASNLSDTSASCDKSTNNKLDNGQVGSEGDSNGHNLRSGQT